MLHISEQEVERLLHPERLLEHLRGALMALSAGEVVQPLRSVMPFGARAQASESAQGLLFVKPVQYGEALATKLITLVPGNAARGLPSLMATVLLMDPATGAPLAVIEATRLTALRTAAVSAIAADALAAPHAGVLSLLGSGVLARSHADMLRRVRDIREIRVWSRNMANAERCAHDIGGRPCESAEQAVRGADLVCTVSNASEPILKGAWLKPGAFVAAVGAPRPTWRELDDEAMAQPVIADQREAAETESGDVRLSGASVYAEIGEILSGRVARPAAGRTVVFKSLGLAVEDAVAARLVYEAALAERRRTKMI